jgi:hypothetical protein
MFLDLEQLAHAFAETVSLGETRHQPKSPGTAFPKSTKYRKTANLPYMK